MGFQKGEQSHLAGVATGSSIWGLCSDMAWRNRDESGAPRGGVSREDGSWRVGGGGGLRVWPGASLPLLTLENYTHCSQERGHLSSVFIFYLEK